MDCREFERKLKRLNPKLYVGNLIQHQFNNELLSTGIYFKDENPDKFSGIQELENQPDLYLGWITVKHVPEGNWYSDRGRVIARGWREILLNLASKKYIDLQKARKVFDCPSLGLSDYDKLTQEQKFQKYYKRAA